MSYQKELKKREDINIDNLKYDLNKTTLRIELSNICNHQCIFCPNSKMNRKRCYMNEDLIYRLLKEGRSLEKGGIEEVGLFMNGEPFVSKNLSSYIKYAKEIGYKHVFITTNGALADTNKLKSVIDAGLDSIKFSINAGSRETYKIVHKHDDYDKVIENLKFVYKYKMENNLDIKILSSFVITKYTNDEIDGHYNNIKPYVDEIVFFDMDRCWGIMEEETKEISINVDTIKAPKYKRINKLPCPELFRTICVTAEGYLALCCANVFNDLVVEDLNKMSLADAWNSEKMQQIRKAHYENKIDGTLCYNCIYEVGKEEHMYKPINKQLFDISNQRN